MGIQNQNYTETNSDGKPYVNEMKHKTEQSIHEDYRLAPSLFRQSKETGNGQIGKSENVSFITFT